MTSSSSIQHIGAKTEDMAEMARAGIASDDDNR